MAFSLNRAIAGAAGGAGEVLGEKIKSGINTEAAKDLISVRAEIERQRDERLEGYASGREQRGYGFTRDQNDQNRSLQRDMQASGFVHSETLQTNQQEFLRGESTADRALRARALDQQSVSIGLERKKVDLLVQAGALDLEQRKRLDGLQTEYMAETDPVKREALGEKLLTLTGKWTERYQALPMKDDTGNITGYQMFDQRRGEMLQPKGGAAAGTKAGERPSLSSFNQSSSANSTSAQPSGGGLIRRNMEPPRNIQALTGDIGVITRQLEDPKLRDSDRASLAVALETLKSKIAAQNK